MGSDFFDLLNTMLYNGYLVFWFSTFAFSSFGFCFLPFILCYGARGSGDLRGKPTAPAGTAVLQLLSTLPL